MGKRGLAVVKQVGHVARLPDAPQLAADALGHKIVSHGACSAQSVGTAVNGTQKVQACCNWPAQASSYARRPAAGLALLRSFRAARTFRTSVVPHGAQARQQGMHLRPPVLPQLAARTVNQPLHGRGGMVGQKAWGKQGNRGQHKHAPTMLALTCSSAASSGNRVLAAATAASACRHGDVKHSAAAQCGQAWAAVVRRR